MRCKQRAAWGATDMMNDSSSDPDASIGGISFFICSSCESVPCTPSIILQYFQSLTNLGLWRTRYGIGNTSEERGQGCDREVFGTGTVSNLLSRLSVSSVSTYAIFRPPIT